MNAKANFVRHKEQARFVSNPVYDISDAYKPMGTYNQCPQGIISSVYHKFSHATIRDGERVAIWDQGGRVIFVDGPARPFLYQKTIDRLRRFHADAQNYLIVKYLDGKKEHIQGPCSLFFDPTKHDTISVTHSINLNMDEAMVVYRRQEEKDELVVKRNIVYGPALYTPTSLEWVQEFSWGNGENAGSAPSFVKLKMVPEQVFVDVSNVRTTDDALLVLNFMIIFQLEDIEKMLSCTHDPISDFTTAICSDVIAFISKLSFEAFKGYADNLNDVGNYTNLRHSSEKSGFRVINVVFRGYQPTPALLALQEQSVQTRTQLALEKETEEQKEQLRSFKQHCEFERARERHEMETSEADHKHRLKSHEVDQYINAERVKFQQKIDAQTVENEMQLQFARRTTADKADYLRTLHKDFAVDITRYLVAQLGHRPDKLIKLDVGGDTPIHIHSDI